MKDISRPPKSFYLYFKFAIIVFVHILFLAENTPFFNRYVCLTQLPVINEITMKTERQIFSTFFSLIYFCSILVKLTISRYNLRITNNEVRRPIFFLFMSLIEFSTLSIHNFFANNLIYKSNKKTKGKEGVKGFRK